MMSRLAQAERAHALTLTTLADSLVEIFRSQRAPSREQRAMVAESLLELGLDDDNLLAAVEGK